MKQILEYISNLFEKNGYSIYAVGGTSRDFLLGLEVLDFDFATNATPDQMKKFLPDANYTFSKYGNVIAKVLNQKVEITTFRKESDYVDFRHPSKIDFVDSIEDDFYRRDFTINAIYIDKNLKIFDPANGLNDLKNKIIRFIGNPEKRIKEDPLRILRAERFAKKLNFKLEKTTLEAIEKYRCLLNKINPEKIVMEEKKNNNN